MFSEKKRNKAKAAKKKIEKKPAKTVAKKAEKKDEDWEKNLGNHSPLKGKGVHKSEPKFLTRGDWAKDIKKKRGRHKVKKGKEQAFTVDANLGIAHVMEKYKLTREEALSEMTRLIRSFRKELVRP